MRATRGPNPLWKPAEDFAAIYCVRCKAGWTRSGVTGSITVCLLDREPVLSGMTDCDRFEERAEEHEPHAMPMRPEPPPRTSSER